jgi:hypothetical protein
MRPRRVSSCRSGGLGRGCCCDAMNENEVERNARALKVVFFSTLKGGPARRVSFPRTRNRVAHTGAREAREPIDAASAPSHARIRRHGGPPRGAKLPGRDHVEPVRVCPSRRTAGLVPLREYDRARRARDRGPDSVLFPAPPPPPSAPASRSAKPRTGRSTNTAATRCSSRWRAVEPTRTRRKRRPCVNARGERRSRRRA